MKTRILGSLCVLITFAISVGGPALADRPAILDAIVGIRSEVPLEARTASSLGQVREGTGVLIDGSGLVLTIGYLILEASAVDIIDAGGNRIPASIVAYDHDTGLGLVRGLGDFTGVTPARLGSTEDLEIGAQLLAVSRIGGLDGIQVSFADRRDFAGYWEYMLPQALFTTPVHRQFGGAALLNTNGELVGIGSLFVRDAAGPGLPSPGNMFVPVDALPEILGDMLAFGRRSAPAKPWIGIYGHDHPQGVFLRRLADDGPSYQAGIRPGDIITEVDGTAVHSLAELYTAIWALGDAGIDVPLKVRRGTVDREFSVPSKDRYSWLKFEQSY